MPWMNFEKAVTAICTHVLSMAVVFVDRIHSIQNDSMPALDKPGCESLNDWIKWSTREFGSF